MITDGTITLRSWERDDLSAFTRWFNDPEVTVYLGNAYPCLNGEQETRFYESSLDDKHRYSIIVNEEDRLIGNCSLMEIDHANRMAEVGIVLGEKDCWSQGYGRRALALLLEIGFCGLGLNRVYLRLAAFNHRGYRCYQAAGFCEEGRARQAMFVQGAFHDEIRMSVLADDYLREHERTSTFQLDLT